jgi:hypothetical protein
MRHSRRTLLHAVLIAAVAGCGGAPPTTGLTPTEPLPSVEQPGTGPPAAQLLVQGSSEPGATGQLGTYIWRGEGSDSPWLPGTPARIAAGAGLVIHLSEDEHLEQWTVRLRVAGDQEPGGTRELASGAGPVAFGAPTAGAWSLQVLVTFAGGQGEAAYYWRVETE